ncbi:hypothetical protein AB4G91_02830 [Macrococcoides goetzii]|uniref:hypothetical protein n=1 Tax=Macrococcus sp. PK TaxID=2801919 RepID=UPI001F0DF774|nr:hypothetical protein [Macrococcus sp. PK]MCH4984234.1 hypothetical protein [Macrococcus sp. PK]
MTFQLIATIITVIISIGTVIFKVSTFYYNSVFEKKYISNLFNRSLVLFVILLYTLLLYLDLKEFFKLNSKSYSDEIMVFMAVYFMFVLFIPSLIISFIYNVFYKEYGNYFYYNDNKCKNYIIYYLRTFDVFVCSHDASNKFNSRKDISNNIESKELLKKEIIYETNIESITFFKFNENYSNFSTEYLNKYFYFSTISCIVLLIIFSVLLHVQIISYHFSFIMSAILLTCLFLVIGYFIQHLKTLNEIKRRKQNKAPTQKSE